MVVTKKEQEAAEKAKELDPNIIFDDNGINWHWIYGFGKKEVAEEFDSYCQSNGIETRGVYTAGNSFSVRFRD